VIKAIAQIALGIIAAIGGFVDIGDLVFNSQAGALFGYQLLWAIPIGVVGIMIFAEMSGRVAAIARKANFELVTEHYGPRLALATLVASLVLSGLTLAAELGGVGLVLNLFFDVTPQTFMLIGVAIIAAASWFLSFGAIERIFGYGGLLLLVYVVAAVHLDPDWSAVGGGFVPESQSSSLYWYFVVGLVAAALMPYEIYFYSSGAIEEEWTEKDLHVNRLNAIVGYGIGALLSVGIMMVAAQVLHPAGVEADSIGTVALAAQVPFGETGLVLALLGILFALGGASVDTCFSSAYNLAQHQGWEWGKRKGHRGAPRWTVTWLVFYAVGYAIVVTGVDPVQLTEYAVLLSVIALPLTYLPILLVANDRAIMGEHANGAFARTMGWGYFGVICVLTVAAPVLLFATNGGGG
jgi:manganese transport protein